MEQTDVLIVGGGICGVLAAQQCKERGIPFKLIERCGDFGGVWAFRANAHSHLQVTCRPHLNKSWVLFLVAELTAQVAGSCWAISVAPQVPT